MRADPARTARAKTSLTSLYYKTSLTSLYYKSHTYNFLLARIPTKATVAADFSFLMFVSNKY